MEANNLIFSSKFNSEYEDVCFDMLMEHLSDVEYDKVYVKNVSVFENVVLFFAEIEGKESIIRVPISND